MDTAEMFVGIIVAVILIPFLVFTIMKVGTYAFYKGRQRFLEENDNGEK